MKLVITLLILTFSGQAAEKISFNESVRPILSDKCFHCHGPDKKHIKGKLQLHTFAKATSPLGKKKIRYAITPGNLEKSTLWQRITTQDEDDVMPPLDSHKHLTDREKEILKKWLLNGAEYEKHWAFTEIIKPKLPSANNWSNHPVDRFIYAKLKSTILKPKNDADKRTLIRRLSFDLTGLPPSEKDLGAFLLDNSAAAYEKLVDSLLKKSSYGEHMARYWLDAVRYGDTHGLHGDNYREMYKYRDWVIKAFNDNMRYDQFTIEQLAGDLLENATAEQLTASGFNRLHISNSAGSALEEELYVNNVTDRVNAFGTVFLGLTLGCASCHDHKYDPLSQKEYYQLFAFMNNLDGPSHNMGVKSPRPFLQFPDKKQQQQIDRLNSLIKKEKNTGKAKSLKSQLKKILGSVPSTMIMKERKDIRPAYILIRGEYDNKGKKVTRKTPEALPAMTPDMPLNRLGLAKWLTAGNHPLTARVFVNRLWQQFFGTGIVKTSEDFGSQGQWPSHPKLLNFLAAQFMESGWDVKKLVRFIVTSRTYRQDSKAVPEEFKKDPDNRLLARGSRFRMDAEMLRDQALQISGLLVNKLYGKSVKPPQPQGLWQSVALKGSNTKTYTPDKGDNQYRRSVYTFWKRSLPPPAMTAFNAPTRENCTVRRERTNTPLQALVLMNEEQFFTAAAALAALTVKNRSGDRDRAEYLYEKMLGHRPDKETLRLISETVKSLKKEFPLNSDLAGRKVSAETAAWTMIANSLMSLDSFKTRE